MAQQPHGNRNFYPRWLEPCAGEAQEREHVACHRAAEHGDDGNSGGHRLAGNDQLRTIAVALKIDPAWITRGGCGLPAIRLTIGGSALGIFPYSSTFSPAFAHS
jgi:hypothetical protein